MNVTGLIAVVTGGGRGIGRGIVLALARNGADVAVADIDAGIAGSTTAEVSELGRRSFAVEMDVTDQQSVDVAVRDVVSRFGQIDVLVNNAGVVSAPGWTGRLGENEADWDIVYEVNVKGVDRVTQAVSPGMKERRFGKIINISSVAGRRGNPGLSAYSASKAACISITQAAALELAPYNINVNAICPGLLWTPMWNVLATRQVALFEDAAARTPREQFESMVARTTPLGREQTPEDIGNLAAFLASQYARNITGQSINVNGGSQLS